MDRPTVAPIRVAAADDSYVIRQFLTAILASAPEIDLVAVCSNAKELMAAIETGDPDVVLTDIRMPPFGADEGIRIAARLRETAPGVAVVVLSAYAEPAYALGLFENGTGRRAYLLKERLRSREELIGAIENVARGGSVIDPLIVDVLIQARSRAAHSRLAGLTGREREILAEIAAGKRNGAIAESLVLTKRAVEKHVNSIFSKLGLPETQDVSRRVKATLIFLADQDADLQADRGSVSGLCPPGLRRNEPTCELELSHPKPLSAPLRVADAPPQRNDPVRGRFPRRPLVGGVGHAPPGTAPRQRCSGDSAGNPAPVGHRQRKTPQRQSVTFRLGARRSSQHEQLPSVGMTASATLQTKATRGSS